MTSLCGKIHTISTNRKEGNVHPLLRRVNKIALQENSLVRTNQTNASFYHVRKFSISFLRLYWIFLIFPYYYCFPFSMEDSYCTDSNIKIISTWDLGELTRGPCYKARYQWSLKPQPGAK
ncbi:hypothetical protein RHMOL_Rhmol06G0162900 [Rhododendron molle]|uniref:Uncharacterized protein n=1 Tax=Rhododendron molle TaxID=49168 RepID=A0ACC0NF88_RHOML|nr:hypothetical protein RHMOL_Rhmol06G0162900 [Rhododendron molle]